MKNGFEILNKDNATTDAVPVLEGAQKAFGFTPNLIGIMANAPALAEAYLALAGLFNKTSFDDTEKQVVLLTVSRLNHCHYCMAAHSTVAQMQSVPADVVDAIRNDQPIADRKLQALRAFTTAVIDTHGAVAENDVAAFVAAGYNRQQVLEVILGVGFKTLSNYTNHITDTPVDEAFAGQAWSPSA